MPSHVVDQAVAAGATVTVIDDLSAGRLRNLKAVIEDIEFLTMSLSDERVADVVRRQDIVFHLAANADVPVSVRDPGLDFQSNVVGSFRVLQACLGSDVQKVVFASSAAVYGPPSYVPIDEGHPTRPISPYGAGKLAVEHLGMAYHATYGLPFSAVRIFNSYGVRQPRYVMFDLIRKLHQDPTRLEVLGTGEQIRDYAYVTDTSRFFLTVAAAEQAVGHVYNVAGGNPTSVRDLVALLIADLGLEDVDVSFTGKSWPGDISRLVADIGAARKLGWSPQVDLATGVKALEEWLLQDPSLSEPH